jgi:hypothetical protein
VQSYSSAFGGFKTNENSLPFPKRTPITSAKTTVAARNAPKNIPRGKVIAPSILSDLKSPEELIKPPEKSPASRRDEQFKLQVLKPISNAYVNVPSRVYDIKPAPVLKDQTNYQLPGVTKVKEMSISERGIAKNRQNEERQKNSVSQR